MITEVNFKNAQRLMAIGQNSLVLGLCTGDILILRGLDSVPDFVEDIQAWTKPAKIAGTGERRFSVVLSTPERDPDIILEGPGGGALEISSGHGVTEEVILPQPCPLPMYWDNEGGKTFTAWVGFGQKTQTWVVFRAPNTAENPQGDGGNGDTHLPCPEEDLGPDSGPVETDEQNPQV